MSVGSSAFRERCDHHVDTSSMSASELRRFLSTFAVDPHQIQLNVVTFGFKRGVPSYLDLCVDVRFSPTLTGTSACAS